MMKKLLFIALLLAGNCCAFAQEDEKSVATAVEKLRVALMDANEAELSKLTSPLLTYGHSNGLLENKKAFIEALVSGTANFEKIELSEQTISISGDVALVRHKLSGETHNKGKDPAPINIRVLLVWQKTKGQWLLLARQAFKIP
ncbi:nuclear transport factor 2 family protein [Dyadobacter sp. CY323]|uniref:nuclear transport factor 2 family protein n=1 Tax=Dyadobacter sp. CY323 TaxID=2907302 RepID=UPI001F38B472|nr:nuclear transport factor 2 family protein [Dyadobacter sp. CY323]MCE6990357.1 nuclear transport factor 2 family protein [Dyadobacter sp. CY323]